MRYPILDDIRGITLLSMIVYHLVWDLVYIGGLNLEWYQSKGAFIWQQSICFTFIILSGFCWNLGRNKLKRGGIVFGFGVIIMLVTALFVPENQVIFGILTLLGSCMLICIPLEKFLLKVPPQLGILLSALLFICFRAINEGYLGWGEHVFYELSDKWYEGDLMTYLGFTDSRFFSTDYFSLLPWCFLFLLGYYLYHLLERRNKLNILSMKGIRCIEYIGKHSLIIYLCHQPVLYAVTVACFNNLS